MSDPYAAALSGAAGRSLQLDQILGTLLRQAPDVEAAAVVSFDGLPMASALPAGMDEDRVAAMSAALLSSVNAPRRDWAAATCPRSTSRATTEPSSWSALTTRPFWSRSDAWAPRSA